MYITTRLLKVIFLEMLKSTHAHMHAFERTFVRVWLAWKMNTSRSKLETCQYLLPNPDFHLSWWIGVRLLGDLLGLMFTSLIGIRHAIDTGQMVASFYWSSKYHTPPSVLNLCKITPKKWMTVAISELELPDSHFPVLFKGRYATSWVIKYFTLYSFFPT